MHFASPGKRICFGRVCPFGRLQKCILQAPNLQLTGPKPKEIKVETFRNDYVIRTPKVEKLSIQPIRQRVS